MGGGTASPFGAGGLPPVVVSSASVPQERASAHGSSEKKNPDDRRPAGPPGRPDAARDHVVCRTPPGGNPHLGNPLGVPLEAGVSRKARRGRDGDGLPGGVRLRER